MIYKFIKKGEYHAKYFGTRDYKKYKRNVY